MVEFVGAKITKMSSKKVDFNSPKNEFYKQLM